jgi:dipicolinate synthase subunit A
LLLPLPVTRDGKHVFCPLDSSLSIDLEDLCPSDTKASAIRSDSLVFGGRIPEFLKNSFAEHSIFYFDYYDSPTLSLINAHISAEGALMYAMEATDTAILGRNIAVIGYGRIARSLCRLCNAFGANVTAFARREEARVQARLDGINSAPLSPAELATLTHGFDIIFNTVPARIMKPETVTALPSGTLYMELASSPFGIDAADARRSGAKVIWASAIPGKYAPVTAGEMIADTVRAEIERITSTGGDKS